MSNRIQAMGDTWISKAATPSTQPAIAGKLGIRADKGVWIDCEFSNNRCLHK
ncbi:MAG: hypothetical protein IPN71_18070 [Fibrobacteres bacterium]|nr:hypothetical protein [Fibrobacterota bacterium]